MITKLRQTLDRYLDQDDYIEMALYAVLFLASVVASTLDIEQGWRMNILCMLYFAIGVTFAPTLRRYVRVVWSLIKRK